MIPLGILGTLSGGAAAGAYELISTTILASPATGVTFSSLPTGFKHLQIRSVVKANVLGGNNWQMQFNGDTGSNYADHELYGNGTAVASRADTSRANIFQGGYTRYDDTNQFSAFICDILDYASTTKNKTVKTFAGHAATVSGNNVRLDSGLWMSTAAITSIDVFGSNNMAIGSRFSLYGIK